MAPPPKKKVINFKYQKLHDFKTVQAHGVYGGMTLRGQLNINFYVEAAELAKTSTAPIIGNNMGREEFVSSNEQNVLRELHFGVNLDIETVKKTAEWMIKHVTEFEAKLTALTNKGDN